MTLETIVLPLEQSRALVEHGVVLDTAVSWITDGTTHSRPVIIEPAVYGAVKSRIICPAPVLSELLNAIWAKYPDATISTFHREGFGVDVDVDDDVAGYHNGAGQYPTDLLAAAALLMEVRK